MWWAAPTADSEGAPDFSEAPPASRDKRSGEALLGLGDGEAHCLNQAGGDGGAPCLNHMAGQRGGLLLRPRPGNCSTPVE